MSPGYSTNLKFCIGQLRFFINAMAHMWFNIASANGHDKASTMRDYRASLMANADVSKAQKMARECLSRNYQSCGY